MYEAAILHFIAKVIHPLAPSRDSPPETFCGRTFRTSPTQLTAFMHNPTSPYLHLPFPYSLLSSQNKSMIIR